MRQDIFPVQKAIRDITERLVRMSAAKYITGEVFSKALDELARIQTQCTLAVVGGDGLEGEETRDVLVRRVGEALRRHQGDGSITGHHDNQGVIGGSVGKIGGCNFRALLPWDQLADSPN